MKKWNRVNDTRIYLVVGSNRDKKAVMDQVLILVVSSLNWQPNLLAFQCA